MNATENVEHDAEGEELPQSVTSAVIQDENNTNAEPDMPLEHHTVPIEYGSATSKPDHVPWLGNWLTFTWKKLGRIPRILIVSFYFGVILWGLMTWCLGFYIKKFGILDVIAVAYVTPMLIGTFIWGPWIVLFCVINNLPRGSDLNEESSWITKFLAKQPTRIIVQVVAVVGMAVFDYQGISSANLGSVLPSAPNSGISYMWPAVSMPQSYSKCDARVSPDQASLFTPKIYHNQFDNFKLWSVDNETGEWFFNGIFAVDNGLHEDILANHTLCAQGFQANTDLYGLGLRFGVYAQWISSILSNNFLPADSAVLKQVYLAVCLAICITTVVLSIYHACIFAVEIELLYWLYWGGFVCVFASSPNSIRLGQTPKWIGIDWIMVIFFAMHMVMAYHAIWFVWYAYDMVFSRMPCGTFHFMLAKLPDPCWAFGLARDFFMILVHPFIDGFIFGPPLVMILLLAEFIHFVQTSVLFELVFAIPEQSRQEVLQTQIVDRERSTWRVRDSSVYLLSRKLYFGFRKLFGFPDNNHGRIRLITSIDEKYRRCVGFSGDYLQA